MATIVELCVYTAVCGLTNGQTVQTAQRNFSWDIARSYLGMYTEAKRQTGHAISNKTILKIDSPKRQIPNDQHKNPNPQNKKDYLRNGHFKCLYTEHLQ